MATRPLFSPLLTLHKYFMAANKMRIDFENALKRFDPLQISGQSDRWNPRFTGRRTWHLHVLLVRRALRCDRGLARARPGRRSGGRVIAVPKRRASSSISKWNVSLS